MPNGGKSWAGDVVATGNGRGFDAHGHFHGGAKAFQERLEKSADVYKANGHRVKPLPVKKAAEIAVAIYPEIRWAVPELLPEGLTLLAGPKSRGKSFIVLDLAIGVANGSKALGSVPCEAGDVLYLALEDSERRIQARMRAVLQGAAAPTTLEIATEWPTIDNGCLGDIEAWITSRAKPRLVIIDVLAKVKGAPDARKGVYDQDYALMRPFYEMARKYNIAILLVHHTNKGVSDDPIMRISGTMGLSGACDTTLVLDRASGSLQGELHVRGRDVAERELALQFDGETGCVSLLGKAEDFRRSAERREIIGFLREIKSPQTPIQIAVDIGKNRAAVRKLLSKMLAAGEISRLPNGKYYVTS